MIINLKSPVKVFSFIVQR